MRRSLVGMATMPLMLAAAVAATPAAKPLPLKKGRPTKAEKKAAKRARRDAAVGEVPRD